MKVFLLAVPYDSGYYNLRLGRGARTIQKGLAQILNEREHEIREMELSVNVSFPTELSASFEIARAVATAIHQAKEQGEFPIVCLATAMRSLGILSGLKHQGGVIWFDAHGDFNNPETSVSGFLDGMALSMVTGNCWTSLTKTIPGYRPVPEDRVMLIGAHDVDPLEEKRLHASAITLISAPALRQNADVIHTSFASIKSVYLHIDLDVLDPAFVKVNSFNTSGGILPKELLDVVSAIKKKYEVCAVAFTAYDPSFDPEE